MESSSLIPGFRFHPTDHELVMYYLKRKLMRKKIPVNAVTEVNIYDFSPWDLPDKSSLKSGDLEWFFFCPKSKKYACGSRSNRATETGFWKATGKDRKIEYKGRPVATIKTLVFHLGHALNGERTNWVMHEYNMKDQKLADLGIIQDMFVLCKIFEKEGVGPKNGAQYGAPFKEEEWDRDNDADVASGCESQLISNNLGPTTLSLTEPGSSTLTFSRNETATTNKIATPVNTPASHDDDVMLFEDIVSILDASNKDHNDNINMKGVEVDNMKEVKGVGGNEEDGIYCDLVKLIDLEEFITAEGNKFGAEGGEYSLDMIMGTDDLDADLGRFSVD